MRVARRDARLDKHLLLPVARPLSVIGNRALYRDADFAQRAVGPKTKVDAVALSFAGICGEQIGVPIGDLLIELLVGNRSLTVGVSGSAVEKHQVDIGAVIKLLAAQLAERENGESASAPVDEARLAVYSPRTPRGSAGM